MEEGYLKRINPLKTQINLDFIQRLNNPQSVRFIALERLIN